MIRLVTDAVWTSEIMPRLLTSELQWSLACQHAHDVVHRQVVAVECFVYEVPGLYSYGVGRGVETHEFDVDEGESDEYHFE